MKIKKSTLNIILIIMAIFALMISITYSRTDVFDDLNATQNLTVKGNVTIDGIYTGNGSGLTNVGGSGTFSGSGTAGYFTMFNASTVLQDSPASISPGDDFSVTNAIIIGNTNNGTSGAIRFNNNQFQGYNGTDWIVLASGGSSDTTCETLNSCGTILYNNNDTFIRTVETNETSRFDNLTRVNCSGTDKYSKIHTNGTLVCSADTDTTISDTNASTACSGSQVLSGSGTCIQNTNTSDQIFDVTDNNTYERITDHDADVTTINTNIINNVTVDTNASTACSGSEVLSGSGTCINNTNTTSQIRTQLSNGSNISYSSTDGIISLNVITLQEYLDTVYATIGSGGNSSWNQTYADGLYAVIGGKNQTLLSYLNITDWPVCSGSDKLTADGVTLSCSADASGGGSGAGIWTTIGDTIQVNTTVSGGITDVNFTTGELCNLTECNPYSAFLVDTDTNTDTNASTACAGSEVLNGEGDCIANTNTTDQIFDVVDNSTFERITDHDADVTTINTNIINNVTTDTNASTACSGSQVLSGVGTCIVNTNTSDQIFDVVDNSTFERITDHDADVTTINTNIINNVTTDTNASTACAGSQVLTGVGTCIVNTNTSAEMRAQFTNGTNLTYTEASGTFALNIGGLFLYLQSLFIELTDTFGGDVSGTYDAIQVETTQGLNTGNITSGSFADARIDNDITIHTTSNFAVGSANETNITTAGNIDTAGNASINGLNIKKLNTTHWRISG